MAHQDGLDAPRLRWAGVMASELARYVRILVWSYITAKLTAYSLGVKKEQLIPITKHDEKKVRYLVL